MVLFVIAAFLLMASHARADEPPGLNLGDLPAYRAALDGKPGGAAAPATFRELWDHPSTFLGKRVSIDGRVARRFRQGAIGTFPSLVEAWATSPAGDPFCLVYPAPKGDSPDAAPGASIQFEGVYLRQVTYRGSDAERLAPVIVGDRAPSVLTAAPATSNTTESPPLGVSMPYDWALGLGAAGLIAMALARQHLRKPVPRVRRVDRESERAPEFIDSE